MPPKKRKISPEKERTSSRSSRRSDVAASTLSPESPLSESPAAPSGRKRRAVQDKNRINEDSGIPGPSGNDVPVPGNKFKFTNDECLMLYKSLKNPQELFDAFAKNEHEKFIRGAMCAKGPPLLCLSCKKEYSSSLGLTLHLRKCKEQPSNKQSKEGYKQPDPVVVITPSKSNRGRPPSKDMQIYRHDTVTLADFKKEPTLFFRFSKNDMMKALDNVFPDGKYECFAFKSPGNEPCPSFKDKKEFYDHLTGCIQYMYFTFRGERVNEFRALDKHVRAKYVREAMLGKKLLPCLECGREFDHCYGLQYHVERCNVDDTVRPWKCYRCGFLSTVANSQQHLDHCWAVTVEGRVTEKGIGNVNKVLSSRTSLIGMLGDVNLRSGKAIDKGLSETVIIGGIEKPVSEVNAQDAVDALLTEADPVTPKRRKYGAKASIATGFIPTTSSRVRIVESGRKRFRFRKAEVSRVVPHGRDWVRYREDLVFTYNKWVADASLWPISTRLSSIKHRDFAASKVDTLDNSLIDLEKQSINLRLCVNNAENGKPPVVSQKVIPCDCRRLKTFDTMKFGNPITDDMGVTYCGGPIHTIEAAPNSFDDTRDVVAVCTYPDDDHLTSRIFRSDPSFVQFWLVRHTKEGKVDDNIRSNTELWFILQVDDGQVLHCTWLNRPRNEGDEQFIGFIAIALASGQVKVYRIDKNSFDLESNISAPASEKIVSPDPDITLKLPNLKNDKDEDSANETRDEDEEVKEEVRPPPVTRVAWCAQDRANIIVGTTAAGSVAVWDLEEEDLGSPKFLRDHGWTSPAHDVTFGAEFDLVVAFREKLFRVYDIRRWECILEENTVRTAGCRVVTEPRLFTGQFTYQSEYFPGTADVASTGMAYVANDPAVDGYFVVSMANRHDLMLWDACPAVNGTIVTCGIDGQLLYGVNGHVTPRGSTSDYNISVLKNIMMLTRNCVDVADDDEEDKLREMYFDHKQMTEQMWLDCRILPTEPPRISYTAREHRVESLNAVTVTKNQSKAMTVTGGQAGLLFVLPCDIELFEKVMVEFLPPTVGQTVAKKIGRPLKTPRKSLA